MKKILFSLLAAGIALAPIAGLSSGQIPAAKDVVVSSAYTSFEPVARGHEFQIAVVVKIRDGYHINARETTLDYLIPTDLKFELPAGFTAGEVNYPKGTLKTFAFSKTQALNVYTGTVILRLNVTALPGATMGAQHLPLKLRYQACSEEVCLPPVRQEVDTAFTVAVAGKPAHAEFFKQK